MSVNREAPEAEPIIPIFRLQPGAMVDFLSLSTDVVGFQTHWAGRTLLCPGTADCRGCSTGLEPRWTGYLAASNVRRVVGLLEVSAQAADAFRRAGEPEGLAGKILTVRKGKRFEPIEVVKIRAWEKEIKFIYTAVQVTDMLARILNLPRRRETEEVAVWEERLQRVAAARLEQVCASRV
jgi:hypothetical protein